jgi:hypothetical protein
MVDALAELRASGYVEDFSISGRVLRCRRCGETHEPRDVQIMETIRFEGTSDPDDEAIVFALVCTRCGARGALVTAYGPTVSGEDAAVMTALTDGRRR